jgi:hypothetical protein
MSKIKVISESELTVENMDNPNVLIDSSGARFYKESTGRIIPWQLLTDENIENDLLKILNLNLEDVGKIVYVRVTETGLQSIVGGYAKGAAARGEEWSDITPTLTRDRVDSDKSGLDLEVRDSEDAELRPGWYQDHNGELYQFDGFRWVDGEMSSNIRSKLEYLG